MSRLKKNKYLGKIKKTPSSPDDFELDSVNNPHPKSDYVVRLTAPEFTSICPVTGQPDFGKLTIEYEPNSLCLESKSLKLYLWTFREEGHFCEALASEIAEKIFKTLQPKWVKVINEQSKRGGIETTAIGYFEE